MAEAERVRRKQLAPRRLLEVERDVMAWDMYSRLDEDYTMPVVESQSRPKRRKKVSPSLTTDTHTAVPIALHKKFFYDESQTPLVLGFFEVVVHSVLASFLPSEHDTAPLPSETNQLQSVELVSGESATSLVVKQSVAEPFCCCFSVSLNPASRYIQSLAFLVKSRQVCVSAREDQLHDLFALAARVALSGDILVSPMTLTLTVHLVDAAAFAPASSNALGGRGTYGKQVTALVSHLNAPYCPSHLRPASEKNIEPVFLPTFKRIQLFYLTVKELQRRGGAVDELNLGELNAHLPGMIATLRSYQLRAVGWMLAREGAMRWPVLDGASEGNALHPSWTAVCPEDKDGKVDGEPFYFNFHTGSLSLERLPAPNLPKGGILADEMGLGKTVEMLALILLHSRNKGLERDFGTAFEGILTTYGLIEENNERGLGEDQVQDPALQTGEKGSGAMEPPAPSTEVAEEILPLGTDTEQQPDHTTVDSADEQSVKTSPVEDEMDGSVGNDCSNAMDCIACVCGVSREEGGVEYIQCEECNTWQHIKCVGFRQSLSSQYKCIFCIGKNPIEAKTTLIVSPQSIARQWLDEVKKHTKAGTLSAIFYSGVEHMIHPYTLVSHDIVITTYNVLRKEVYYATTDGTKKSLRHQKKYRITPSPLMTIKWWRLCVDEAQMVESETTKAAEMCLQLQAESRWFVTGTPIQREISDLYGLLLLLGVEPYSTKHWWNRLLWEPYLNFNVEPIAKVFSQLLWRSSKRDVAAELGIPEQVEEIEWLSFSPVEEHFYQRQQDKCLQEAQRLLDYFAVEEDVTIAHLQQYAVNQILTPLLKLRQACLHPHVVRGGIVSMKKTSMTMSELLKQLIKRCKMEAQESLRQLIGALNGLAGICRIQEKWSDAVEMYRSAMSTWQEHMPVLECDYTQRIHTLEGLLELMKEQHCPSLTSEGIDCRDLAEEALELRKKFLEKKQNFVVSSREALLAAHASTESTMLEGMESECGYEWPVLVLAWVDQVGLTQDMLDTLQMDATQRITHWNQHWSMMFGTTAGVQFWILDKWREMQSLRKEVMECVCELCSRDPTALEVLEATQCHLRRVQDEDEDDQIDDDERERCRVCQVERLIDTYEMTLFSASQQRWNNFLRPQQGPDGREVSHGSRGESGLEVVLRSLAGFARSKSSDRKFVGAADKQFEAMEEMKKEFPLIRSAWQAASERVQGFDELSMASLRFTQLLPDEPDTAEPHVLKPFEVEPKRLSLLMDKGSWESELRKTKGQLFYLQSLEKARDIETDNLENCPICIQQLGRQWCVLPCGHSLCVSCTEQMQNNTSPSKWPFSRRKEIRCPVCRVWAKHNEINIVSTLGGQGNSSGTRVEGDHSTKIEAIIRKIADIQIKDTTAKTLVFSQWISLLELLAKGLKQNGIAFEYPYLKGVSGSLQRSLSTFKTLSSVGVLLLPLHIGSNGLNITEATHVILCEPALNPAAEQQAVGRIHRMGQTRRTVVHRFYVKGTVEEKMYQLLHPKGEEGLCTDRLESVETSEKKSELTIREFRELFKA